MDRDLNAMCVLCSVLWTEDHWAEVSAEAEPAEFDDTIVLEVHMTNRGRLRNRALRARFANLLLGSYGVQLHDWEGSSDIVRDSKGSSAVVTDLASLWKVAEQMLGRPLDPLDPRFLDVLRQRVAS